MARRSGPTKKQMIEEYPTLKRNHDVYDIALHDIANGLFVKVGTWREQRDSKDYGPKTDVYVSPRGVPLVMFVEDRADSRGFKHIKVVDEEGYHKLVENERGQSYTWFYRLLSHEVGKALHDLCQLQPIRSGNWGDFEKRRLKTKL